MGEYSDVPEKVGAGIGRGLFAMVGGLVMGAITGTFGLFISNDIVFSGVAGAFGMLLGIGIVWNNLKPKKGYTEDWKRKDAVSESSNTRDDMATTTVNDETDDVALESGNTSSDTPSLFGPIEDADGVAPESNNTRDKGIRYTRLRLSQRNWKVAVRFIGRRAVHDVERDGTQYTLQIRTLSKEAPVPFPQGLDVLDDVDYLVICNNLQGHPNLIVMEPKIVKDVIHKDPYGGYWLQPKSYSKYGRAFDQVFT